MVFANEIITLGEHTDISYEIRRQSICCSTGGDKVDKIVAFGSEGPWFETSYRPLTQKNDSETAP